METENDPRTAELTLNSAITFGIAGENMADPVGLNINCELKNGKVREKSDSCDHNH